MSGQEATSSLNTLERLDDTMRRASDGDLNSAEEFYRWLVTSTLHVPDSVQSLPIENTIKSAPPFLSVLAIDDNGTPTIPAFSHPELIAEWAGRPLTCREVFFGDLLALLPEGWSIGVNFGRDPEKEITWWEAVELKGGIEALPSILAELFPNDEPPEALGTTPLPHGSYPELEKRLTALCEREKEILRIALLKEESVLLDGSPSAKILIGVEVARNEKDLLENISALVSSEASQGLIGNDPFRVFIAGKTRENLVVGLFRGVPPLFERADSSPNILKRLASILSPFSKGNP